MRALGAAGPCVGGARGHSRKHGWQHRGTTTHGRRVQVRQGDAFSGHRESAPHSGRRQHWKHPTPHPSACTCGLHTQTADRWPGRCEHDKTTPRECPPGASSHVYAVHARSVEGARPHETRRQHPYTVRHTQVTQQLPFTPWEVHPASRQLSCRQFPQVTQTPGDWPQQRRGRSQTQADTGPWTPT